MDALDPTAYVSPSQLEQALRQQEEAMKRQIETLGALDSKVDAINGDLDKLAQQMKEAEVRKIRGANGQFAMRSFLWLHTHSY